MWTLALDTTVDLHSCLTGWPSCRSPRFCGSAAAVVRGHLPAGLQPQPQQFGKIAAGVNRRIGIIEGATACRKVQLRLKCYPERRRFAPNAVDFAAKTCCDFPGSTALLPAAPTARKLCRAQPNAPPFHRPFYHSQQLYCFRQHCSLRMQQPLAHSTPRLTLLDVSVVRRHRDNNA